MVGLWAQLVAWPRRRMTTTVTNKQIIQSPKSKENGFLPLVVEIDDLFFLVM